MIPQIINHLRLILTVCPYIKYLENLLKSKPLIYTQNNITILYLLYRITSKYKCLFNAYIFNQRHRKKFYPHGQAGEIFQRHG